MRCHGSKVQLCHGCNLSALKNTAAVTQVRLHHADCLFLQQFPVLPLAKQALTGSNGNRGGTGNIHHTVHVFRQTGFFNKHGLIRLQFFRQPNCHSRADTAMEVNGQIHAVTDFLTNCCKPVHMSLGIRRIFNGLYRSDDGVLQCGITFRDPLLGIGHHFFQGIITGSTGNFDMGVHPDFLPALAAQHFVHGAIIILTLNIPHSLLDAADGREHQRTTTIETAAVQSLYMMLNLHGVLAHQIVLKFLYHGFHGIGMTFQNRFTQAVDICVSIHFHEHPTGLDFDQFQLCNLHS